MMITCRVGWRRKPNRLNVKMLGFLRQPTLHVYLSLYVALAIIVLIPICYNFGSGREKWVRKPSFSEVILKVFDGIKLWTIGRQTMKSDVDQSDEPVSFTSCYVLMTTPVYSHQKNMMSMTQPVSLYWLNLSL